MHIDRSGITHNTSFPDRGNRLGADTPSAVWSTLTRHLERTQGEIRVPSVVFLAFDSPRDMLEFRHLVREWTRVHGLQLNVPPSGNLSCWMNRSVPLPDPVWLEVPDDAGSRLETLGQLNENRVLLHTTLSGCLMVVGPPQLLDDVARYARDLWAVQAFSRRVGITVRPDES